MRSDKQIEASRRNGALSRGPVSPEGKAISSLNAITHGLTSRTVLLRHESSAQFQELLQSNLERFQPADATEARIVEEYSVSEWLLRRAWSLITALLDNSIDQLSPQLDESYAQLDHITRAALAHSASIPSSLSLRELHNHASRHSRACDRALRRLRELRNLQPALELKKSENEPKPSPHLHLESDSDVQ